MDFERRAAFSPDTVYHHRSRGWRYIPVHDFADESSTVVQCADCWCLLGEDAALLECIVSEASQLEPGLYARIEMDSLCWPKLLAVMPEQTITRANAEQAMEMFVELGFPDGFLAKLSPGDPLVRVSK